MAPSSYYAAKTRAPSARALRDEELIPRLKDIELNGDVRRVRSNFVNGIKAFPVKVTPA